MIEAKKYEEKGFLFPIDVVEADEISAIRKDFELAEAELANDLKRLSLLRSYPAQLLPSFDKLIHNENLDQLQFSYMDWHDQNNKIKKNGYYLIPSRGNNYYDNVKSNNERTGKWPLFSLRPSINRVSKILEIGYFKKNLPIETWTQKFEYDYAFKFMEKKGIKGSIIGGYVFRNKNHYSTY